MVRTRLSPRCWATSSVSVRSISPSVDVDLQRVEELGHRVARELDVDDRADDPDDAAGAPCGLGVSSAVAVISSHSLLRRERVGAADDLADFLGDLGLPGLVGLQGQVSDQVVRRCRSPPSSRAGGRPTPRPPTRAAPRRSAPRCTSAAARRTARPASGSNSYSGWMPPGVLVLDVLDDHRRHPLAPRRLRDHGLELACSTRCSSSTPSSRRRVTSATNGLDERRAPTSAASA